LKTKNLSLLKLATGFIALLFCANVNAALIESRTLQGDNGGTYTYQLYSDRLEFSLGFSDVFDMTSILFQLQSRDDLEKLELTGDNFLCNYSNTNFVCSRPNNQAADSFTGTLSFLPEFQSLFQFTGYNFDRSTIRTLSTIDGNFETFYTGSPNISAITQSAKPVNSPAIIGMFALALIFVLGRRINIHCH